MEMRFFWIGDKVAQGMYKLSLHPGQENLADYQSKLHIGSHHCAVQPWYLYMKNFPRVLPGAERPSTLKGCVGTLKDGYTHKLPLSWAPQIQHAIHVTIPGNYTCYLTQIQRIPTWRDLTGSLAGLGRRTLLPFALYEV
jgi:hypothetical protein